MPAGPKAVWTAKTGPNGLAFQEEAKSLCRVLPKASPVGIFSRGLCVNLLFLRSSQKIIQRDFKDIRNFQQDFHFGFPRHQLIILIRLLGDIAIDYNLPLGEPFLFSALF